MRENISEEEKPAGFGRSSLRWTALALSGISAFLLSVSELTAQGPPIAGTAQINMSPNPSSTTVGMPVQVALSVDLSVVTGRGPDGSTTPAVAGGYQIRVAFDRSLLRFDSAIGGTSAGYTTPPTSTDPATANAAGNTTVVASQTSPNRPTGLVSVATLNFTTLGVGIASLTASSLSLSSAFQPGPPPAGPTSMPGTGSSAQVEISGGGPGPLSPTSFHSADMDGDSVSDIVIFRPDNGTWYVHRSNGTGQFQRQWGTSGDVPVPGNYGGDGRADTAVWRPSNGTWYVQTADATVLPEVQFGSFGDRAVPGNYGGDGRTDFAVWRPSNGTWYMLAAEGSQLPSVQWGTSGDQPVPGDYDGDGVTDLTVFRPANGTWYVNRSTGGVQSVSFGLATDIAVSADFSGDGRADFGIFRPSDGSWHVLRSDQLATLPPVSWGQNDDIALPANASGDARADYVVWRPSNGTWYVRNAEGFGLTPLAFGVSGDIPVAR